MAKSLLTQKSTTMENIKLCTIITNTGHIKKNHIDMNGEGLHNPQNIGKENQAMICLNGNSVVKETNAQLFRLIEKSTQFKYWHIISINELVENVNDIQEGEALIKVFKEKAIAFNITFYLYR